MAFQRVQVQIALLLPECGGGFVCWRFCSEQSGQKKWACESDKNYRTLRWSAVSAAPHSETGPDVLQGLPGNKLVMPGDRAPSAGSRRVRRPLGASGSASGCGRRPVYRRQSGGVDQEEPDCGGGRGAPGHPWWSPGAKGEVEQLWMARHDFARCVIYATAGPPQVVCERLGQVVHEEQIRVDMMQQRPVVMELFSSVCSEIRDEVGSHRRQIDSCDVKLVNIKIFILIPNVLFLHPASPQVNIPLGSLGEPVLMGVALNHTSAGRPSAEFYVRSAFIPFLIPQIDRGAISEGDPGNWQWKDEFHCYLIRGERITHSQHWSCDTRHWSNILILITDCRIHSYQLCCINVKKNQKL